MRVVCTPSVIACMVWDVHTSRSLRSCMCRCLVVRVGCVYLSRARSLALSLALLLSRSRSLALALALSLSLSRSRSPSFSLCVCLSVCLFLCVSLCACVLHKRDTGGKMTGAGAVGGQVRRIYTAACMRTGSAAKENDYGHIKSVHGKIALAFPFRADRLGMLSCCLNFEKCGGPCIHVCSYVRGARGVAPLAP